jgi:hypothetical protein
MARLFNGTSDRIDLANEANFDFEWDDPFSGACWHWNNAGNASRGLIAKEDLTILSDLRGWNFFQRFGGTNSQYCVELANDSATVARTRTTNEFTGGTWRHVGFTYSGNGLTSGITIYVAGAAEGKTDISDTLANNTILNAVPCQIGCRDGTSTPAFFQKGNIAGVGIWNVELTAGNFTTLATGADPLDVQNANLIAALPLCGYSPEPDKKGDNDGTLTGTTAVFGPNQFVGCGEPVMWLKG